MKQVIHIGGNKTASTLFQRHLFAVHPKIAYIGEDCTNYKEINQTLALLIHEDDSFYNETAAREIFKQTPNQPEKKVLVFSCEDIMGTRHPSVCARRLKNLMPEAQVTMVIRNQLTVWRSWYINHGAYLKLVPRRYWRRYVGFDEWLEYCFSFPYQTPVEAMNYNRYYDTFSKFFGAANMRVIVYEDLKTNPQKFFDEWADILDLSTRELKDYLSNKSERPRNSQRRFKYHQWSAYAPEFFKKNVESLLEKWLDRGKPAEIAIPDKWIQQINSYYGPGNKALAEKTNLDIKTLGYPHNDQVPYL